MRNKKALKMCQCFIQKPSLKVQVFISAIAFSNINWRDKIRYKVRKLSFAVIVEKVDVYKICFIENVC